MTIGDWISTFQQSVRDNDTTRGRTLFLSDVTSFGTVAIQCDGLSKLVSDQWAPIWQITFGFHFENFEIVEDEQIACVYGRWKSWRKSDGIPRHGRATILLRRFAQEWRGIHTHFSMNP